MTKFKVIDFPHFNDQRGTLTAYELDENFPFPVKRVYLVTAHESQTRGGHAHLIESEVFVAANGSIEATINEGDQDNTIILNQPNQALLVEKMCWHEFKNFSPGATLLCFSSTHYLPGEANYITDKTEFLSKAQTDV